MGIDSLFCLVESVITGMVDMWPKILRPKRTLFTIGICTIMFLLGIPMTTHVSIQSILYIFIFIDFEIRLGIGKCQLLENKIDKLPANYFTAFRLYE